MNKKQMFMIIFQVQLGMLLLNIVFKNKMLSIFNILFFIIIISIFLYKESKFSMLNSYFLFSCFRCFFSVVVLEFFHINMKDYNITSYYKGSIDEFILVIYLIIISLFYFYKKSNFNRIDIEISNKLLFFNFLLVTGMLIYVLQIRLTNGFIHRVYFANRYLFNNFGMHFIQIILFAIPLYVGIAIKKNSNISLLILLELFIYGYLIGEKFGLYYNMICFVLMGFGLKNNNFYCKKIWLNIIGVFIVIVVICLSVFSKMYKIDHKQSFSYLTQRISQDNESWWYFYEEFGTDNNLENEMKSIKYKGTQDLYQIGYTKARNFGSHYLRKKMIGEKRTQEEYLRKKRIATGTFSQLALNGRYLYVFIIFYTYFSTLIQKKIVIFLKFRNIVEIVFNILISSFLLRLYLTLKTGLFQINNDFFNLKTLELIGIIGVIICMKQVVILTLQQKKK